MADHNTLTGTALHEPKGISTALANTAYVADGAGSGSWQAPGGQSIGEMLVTNNASTIALTAGTLTTDTDYVKVDGGIWTGNSMNNDITFNANGSLDINTDGIYIILFWSSFSIDAVGTNLIAFKYSTDGTNTSLSNRKVTRQSNNANDVGSISANGLVSLSSGDNLSLWVVCDSNTNITAIDAGFSTILLRAT